MNLKRLKRIAKHNTTGLDIICMLDFGYAQGKREYEISIPIYFWKDKKQFIACYEYDKGIIIYGKGKSLEELDSNFKSNLNTVLKNPIQP